MAKPELRDHRKFLKLKRLLNAPTPHVIGYLDCLWHRGYQTGDPVIGDSLDVEAAAEYPGEEGRFADAAHKSGFIDLNENGVFSIHDLYDHAPRYAQMRMSRKGTAPARACKKITESCTGVQDNFENDAARRTEPRTKNQEPRTKNQEPNTEKHGDDIQNNDEVLNHENATKADFEILVKIWPKPQKMEMAWRFWAGMFFKKKDVDEVIAIAREWIDSPEWKKDNGRFVPYLVNWLQDHGWKTRPPKKVIEDIGPKQKTRRDLEFEAVIERAREREAERQARKNETR